MESIIDKVLPKTPVHKEPKKIGEEPKKFGLLLYSDQGRNPVCLHVLVDILDMVFHKSKQEISTLGQEYLSSKKIIVYTGSLDVVNTKLNESVPALLKKLKTDCGGRCSLNIKSIQL